MRRHERLIDPGGHARTIRERRLGGIPERELADQQRKEDRYDRMARVPLTVMSGAWFRENIGSAGAGTYGMRLMTLDSTTTLVASGTGLELKMGNAGKVWGGILYSSTAVTAGNATLAVQIDSGTPHLLSDVILNTTNPRSFVYKYAWEQGIPFSAGQTIEPAIVADGAFAPTTADMVAWLFIGWE